MKNNFFKALEPYIPMILLYGTGAIIAVTIINKLKPGGREIKDLESGQDDIADELNQEASAELPTYANSVYNSLADTIHESVRYSAVDDDKEKAVTQLKKMKNDADVAKLYSAYGLRQNYFFMVPDGAPKDLFTMINDEIEDGFFSDLKTELVNDWKSKNIKAVTNIS